MTWKNYRHVQFKSVIIKFLVTSRIVGSERRKDQVSNGIFDYYVYLSVFCCCCCFNFYFLFRFFVYLTVTTRAVIGRFSVPYSTGSIEWSLRAVCEHASSAFIFASTSSLEITNGEQRALRNFPPAGIISLYFKNAVLRQ